MLKYIADPSLGSITIEDQLILELVKTKEFNRLTRILHLGTAHLLFPGATHNRFIHSLGVYELARISLRHIQKTNPISDDTYQAILAAALLHDIGHGPLSHVFEKFSVTNHEEQSIKIILSDETEVGQILLKKPEIRKQIVQIIEGKHPLNWASQLISSEIDVDRLDYLLRDSLMTGTNYGRIDWRWLIENITIVDNKLTFYEKGVQAVESLILARYYMNRVCYHNTKVEGYSELFVWIINRFIQLHNEGKLKGNYLDFMPILDKKVLTVQQFQKLDDYFINKIFVDEKELENDPILNKLIDSYFNRRHPKIITDKKEIEKIKKSYDPKLENITWSIVKQPVDFPQYLADGLSEALIYTHNQKIITIKQASTIFNLDDKGEASFKEIALII